jgi:hypothetical protein
MTAGEAVHLLGQRALEKMQSPAEKSDEEKNN